MQRNYGILHQMFLKVYIYINPDLSVRERQAQKKLRLELARRKENGESNIFIRRGRIVKQRSPSQPRESTSEAMEDQSG